MRAAMNFLYFAYGSNMLTQRLKDRVPSAHLITLATLSGYELRWHKVSQDRSGKCDVVQIDSPNSKVIGVVYEILISEKAALDEAEGLGNGYDQKQVLLETVNGPLQAQTYYATKIDPSAVPYDWYKALVIAGAKQHKLPEGYISALEKIVAKIDANAQRAKKNFSIADSTFAQR